MTVDQLKTLYDYSYWANEKLFATIEKLPEEVFTKEIAGSFGSIRNTLSHILSAEWGWMDRCGGPARPGKLNPEDFPTLAALRAAWDTVKDHMHTFLDGLKDEDLLRDITYPGYKGTARTMPLGDLLQHTANHAVHHRGQVSLLIRMQGYAPQQIDMLFYFADKNGTVAW